jgi:hypothetical protein
MRNKKGRLKVCPARKFSALKSTNDYREPVTLNRPEKTDWRLPGNESVSLKRHPDFNPLRRGA